MTETRYWLVKAPHGDIADTVCGLLRNCEHQGVQVVEIKPEKRGTNWMEAKLAEQLTKDLG